jgi:aminoglycoside phosphotransferase (APT) family kinase protein
VSIVRRIAHVVDTRRHRQRYAEFRSLVRSGRLDEAIIVGHVLVEALPSNSEIRRSLANCHARLGDDDTAAALLLAGLEPGLVRGLEAPLAAADRSIDPRGGQAPPWRLMPKGISNVCVVEHGPRDAQGGAYITKVIRGSRRHKEVRFFETIADWSPELARMAPRLLLCQSVPRLGLTMLTIEKIEGRLPTVDDRRKVAAAHDVLTRARVPPSLTSHPRSWFAHDTIRREIRWRLHKRIDLRHTLCSVHLPPVNAQTFRRLAYRASRERWPAAVADVLNRLRRVVIDDGALRAVDPARDYAFIHGDFQVANLLVDARDERLRVLDWESYRFGPPAVDVARYCGVRHMFSEVDDAFMASSRASPTEHADTNGSLQDILLTYALLVSWFDELPHGSLADHADSRLLPAIEKLEQLVRS